MYSVYCDGELIYDLDSENNVLIDPTANLELNKAATLDFTMPPGHPLYDKIERFKSKIQILQDGDEIFKGRAIQVQDDMYKQRYIYCEGELAYLNDSIQRPAEFHLDGDAVQRYMEILIENHNSQVDEDRQFELGIVTVGDPNDYLYRYTNYNSTMEEIKEDLVDDLGGYLRVRNVYENDNPLGKLLHRYLDYVNIEEYGKTSEQAIEFGENLLDYLSDIDQTDICTGIIPLGALLEDENEFSALQVRLTIEDVNEGSDYLVIPEAVEKYGLILKTVTWDDVTTPEALKSNGEAYLQTYEYDSMTIEATAVDLSLLTSGGSSRETLTLQTVLEAYDTVTYTLTAKNAITEILSYEVTDNEGTGDASITRISFSGKTVSVTVDSRNRYDDLNIKITVVVATTGSVEAWRLGDMIFVQSTPHNLSDRFPLAKMQIPLAHPENTTVSLGTFTDTSLTARTNQTASGLRNFEDFSTGNIIASAVAQATALIDMKTNGYVTLHMDEDRGCVDELLIMDTPSTDTATRVWRWNLNGLGYSGSGYDTEHGASYETAITMDGHILGTLIIANGMILADDKDVEFAKFTDEGMKIYAQSGRDDLMLMTIGRTGMDIYDDTGKAILGSFNSSGVQIYNTSYLLMGLYADGMKLYNADGSTLMRLFSGGLRVYNTSGIVRSSLDPDSIDIYDDDGNVLMEMNDGGAYYYYSGNLVGSIGTGYWSGYPNNRGLGFHLENSAAYMSFGWKKTANATEYTAMIAYHTSNSSEAQGIHFGDTVFLNGYDLYFAEKKTGPYMTAGTNGVLCTGGDFYFQNCQLWYGENSNTCYKVLTTISKATVTLKNGSRGSAELEYYVAGTWELDLADLFSDYALASSLSGYATEQWVKEQGYLTSSSSITASSATKLATARNIALSYNKTNFASESFDGSDDIAIPIDTLLALSLLFSGADTFTKSVIVSGSYGNLTLSGSLGDTATNTPQAAGLADEDGKGFLYFASDDVCLTAAGREKLYLGAASTWDGSIIMGSGYCNILFQARPIEFLITDNDSPYQGLPLYMISHGNKVGWAESGSAEQDLFLYINAGLNYSVHLGHGYGDEVFIGENSEYVYIGNSSCGTRVYGTFDNDSDERLKTSIEPLEKSAIDNLIPVSFKWKDGDGRQHYGYIAQQVQEYFPELVREDNNGMLGLAYLEIIALLHNKINQQQAIIKSLKEAISYGG